MKLEGERGWVDNSISNKSSVVDTVPVPAIPAGLYRTSTNTDIEMPTFCTGLNTGHTSRFRAIPAGTEKSFFFFFVIFEFL